MKGFCIRALALVVAFSGCMVGTLSAGDKGHTVYTMSNAQSGNAVLAFEQRGDTLVPTGTFSTEGKGSGGGLGNQGALTFSEDGETLLVANPGSDDISVFRIDDQGLTLVDKVGSGGISPISIAAHEDWVYVLNAGGAGNITGFELTSHDK